MGARGASGVGGNRTFTRASGYARTGKPPWPSGRRPRFFLYTDDFGRDYRDMQARGVTFLREPRHETYGTVAVFADLYGNKWDLVQLKSK